MITVIDSGVANLTSVMAALGRLDIDAEVTSESQKIRAASHVILPGVGSASAAMAQLKTKGLTELLPQLKQPVLGICLGMQLLFTDSEESGGTACLNIIPGKVQLLPSSPTHPVPHMGWNTLKIQNEDHPLLQGIDDDSFVYFVHSYAAPVSDVSLATTHYSSSFTSIAGYKNFFGCQFHPERSSIVGNQILKNFITL